MPLVQYFRARRIWKARRKGLSPEAALQDSYAIAAQHEKNFTRAFLKVARNMITPAHEAAFLKAWEDGSVSGAMNALPYFDDDPAEGAIEVFNDKMEEAYLGVIQEAGDEVTTALNAQFKTKLRFSALPPSDLAVAVLQKAQVRFSVPVNPYSLKWVRENGLNRAVQMTQTQKKTVNSIIGDAMEQGIRPTDMVKQIKSNIGLTDRQAGAAIKRKQLHLATGMSEERAVALTSKYQATMLGQRATMIARTETIRAQSQGRLDAWVVAEESGGLPPVEREWVTQPPSANPNSPCEICLNLDGMKTTLKGTYESDEGPLVGPPAHPGCVCTEILGRAPTTGQPQKPVPKIALPPVIIPPPKLKPVPVSAMKPASIPGPRPAPVATGFDKFKKINGKEAGPIFRSTDYVGAVRESSGAHAALTDGVYFGESAEAVKGYGKHIVEYRTTANKLLVVDGDLGMDEIRSRAEKWATPRINTHLADVQAGVKTLDIELIDTLGTPSKRVRSYLEANGYQGLKYKHIRSGDHHNQMVIFRTKHVSEIGEIP